MSRPIKKVADAPDGDDFVSARVAARLAGCAENTVLRMGMAGQIRARNTVVNVSLFSLADVKRELEKRTEFAGKTDKATAGSTAK